MTTVIAGISPIVWTWILSVAGGALLFAAGALFVAARRAAQAPLVSGQPPPAGLDLSGPARQAVEEARAELLARVSFADADSRSTRLELEAQGARFAVVNQQLDDARARLAAGTAKLHAAEEEKRLLAQRLRTKEGEARAAITERDDSRREAETVRHAQAQLKTVLEGERVRALELEANVKELAGHLLAAPRPEIIEGLRHDLAVVQEQARARQQRAERLEDENAVHRTALAEMAALAAERNRLYAETEQLKASALLAPTFPRSTASAQPRLQLVPGVGPSRGYALQAMVDEIRRDDQVRTVVIADELGLVVAAAGEHGEELAAAGIVISHAVAQAGQLLPVSRFRRVTVRDEHSVAITVLPLAHDDEKDNPLSLVILALEPFSEDRVARLTPGPISLASGARS